MLFKVREGSVYKLLPLEHKLSSLQVRLDRALKMLDQLLASDEDMAAMYLTRYHATGRKNPDTDHLQIELILETYRSRLEELVDGVAEMGRQIDSTRSVFALSLDNTRNRIARINLRLTMGTLAVSFSMTVAGLHLRFRVRDLMLFVCVSACVSACHACPCACA